MTKWKNDNLSFQISRRPRELFKRSSVGIGKAGDVAPSDIKAEVL